MVRGGKGSGREERRKDKIRGAIKSRDEKRREGGKRKEGERKIKEEGETR